MKSPSRNRQQSRRSPDDNSQLHTSLSQKKDSSKVWQLHSTCLIQRSCACGTAVIRPGIPRKKKSQSSPGSIARHMISDVFYFILCILYIILYIIFIISKSSRVGTLTFRAVHKKNNQLRSVYEWRWITTKPSLTGC